jgi:uncharacterized protein (TIGR02145 family)
MINETRIPIVTCRNGYYLRWFYNGWHYWVFYSATTNYLTAGEKYRTTGIRTVELSSGVVTSAQIDAVRSILNSVELYLYTDGGWSECRVQSGNVDVQRNQIDAFELQCKIVIGSRKISDLGYSVGVNKFVDVPFVPIPGDICELSLDTIYGKQTWLCKNWNAGVFGSKWYNNNIANREIYGGLYTWDQINDPSFCPTGWHIPTAYDWNVLLGILVNWPGFSAGGLKEIGFSHWDEPNAGATDLIGWTARGSGSAYIQDGTLTFSGLKQRSYYWINETFGGVYNGYVVRMRHDSGAMDLIPNVIDNFYASVRLIKDAP